MRLEDPAQAGERYRGRDLARVLIQTPHFGILLHLEAKWSLSGFLDLLLRGLYGSETTECPNPEANLNPSRQQ